jgi:hypothetical protein
VSDKNLPEMEVAMDSRQQRSTASFRKPIDSGGQLLTSCQNTIGKLSGLRFQISTLLVEDIQG